MEHNKKKIVRVCRGQTCGYGRGSEPIFNTIEQFSKQDNIDLDYCSCLGHCGKGPNVQVDDNYIIGAKKNTIREEIKKGGVPPQDLIGDIDIYSLANDL